MGVSTAMYAAITGLGAMGTAMSVISNNIANVNTLGFKASRSYFQDMLSQSANTPSGLGQIGRGVRLGAVTQVFSQGAFSNSTQDTDIAIAGEGFFRVQDPLTGELFYTRAGNFIFDKDGQMVTPSGFILQGWELDEDGNQIGTPDNVIMSQFNVPPEVTTQAHFVANLDSTADSRTNDINLSDVWDGIDLTDPIDGDAYVYQTSIRIYDDLGGPHDLSVYFDPDNNVDNAWEYIICVDPSEDVRENAAGDAFADTRFAGMLQRGRIVFEPDATTTQVGGRIRSITAENISNVSSAVIDAASNVSGLGAITITSDGRYTGAFDSTYSFDITSAGAGTIGGTPPPTLNWSDGSGSSGTISLNGNGPYTIAEGLTIDLNPTGGAVALGDHFEVLCHADQATWVNQTPNADGYYNFDAAFLQDPTTGLPITQNVSINLGAKNPNGAGAWVSDNLATTQYASSSTTVFQTQDGFASGFLQSVSIDADGVLTGSYSNGRNQSVFQIGVAIFRNQWGLEKIGNNLYSTTRESGDGTYNAPGTGGAGAVAPNSLEQSNVDLADEFVDMIIQQRGFQANSKVITTTDTMLAEMINLKR